MRSQVRMCSIFWNLGWSWHDHSHWQGYQVPAQIQSPVITNKMYKKSRTFRKMGFNAKTVWRFQTKKNRDTNIDFAKNPSAIRRPFSHELNIFLANSMNKLNKLWKRASRSKLFEAWKNRTYIASPDMFIFFVVLVGHDKITDVGSATMCRLKVNGPSLPTKCSKNDGLFEKWALTWKQIEDSIRKKRTKTIFSTYKKLSGTRGLWMQLGNRELVNRQKQTDGKMKKNLQIKTVRTLQD